MAKPTVRIEGLADLEKALAELPKSTARNTLVRALRKAAQPIANEAKSKVPVRSGKLRDSIIVTSKVRNLTGLKEYGQTLQAGGSRKEAGAALRGARRAGGGEGSRAEISVGPTDPKAHLLEFGTIKMSAQPYMRPAWESKKDEAALSIKQELASEIEKSRARLARKAARLAAKG